MKANTRLMAKDFYKILGIERGASADEIQKAYRKAARENHPDLNPDDKSAKERFQEVQSAYEVLNDPEKRQMYDRYGDAYEQMGGGGPGAGRGRPGAGPNPFEDVDLSDIFGGGAGGGGFADLFRQFSQGAGGGGAQSARRAPRPKGRNLRHEVTVSFHTSVVGGEVPVGVVEPNGAQKTINIKIPAGIEDGKKIRLRGQGEPSPRGGEPGDLLVTVRVGSHPCYRRIGNDLEISVPITLTEAALGGKVDVPTPKGTISLTIPPGTNSGKRLRVRGLGIETDKKKGDLFAEVQIVLPPNLSAEAKELLEKVEAERTVDPRENLKW